MAHQVVLNWTASTDPVVGYNVYRSLTAGSEAGPALNATPIVGTTYTDIAVAAGTKYDYVVTAVSAAGVESVHSNEASNIAVPLFPPTNLVAVAS